MEQVETLLRLSDSLEKHTIADPQDDSSETGAGL